MITPSCVAVPDLVRAADEQEADTSIRIADDEESACSNVQ